MEFFGWLLATTLGVIAIVIAKGARRTADIAEDEARHLRVALENLGKRVSELRKAAAAQPAPAESSPEPSPVGEQAPSPVAPPPVVSTVEAPVAPPEMI